MNNPSAGKSKEGVAESRGALRSRIARCWSGGAALFIAVFVVSCAAPALRNQFHNYNEAYAAALNQQMLLNLARLENGHPAYFLALGPIDNKYTFQSQSTAGGTAGRQKNTGATQNSLFPQQNPSGFMGILTQLMQTTFGFNANEVATVTSNPEFQFIPINNETSAKQVLQPISTDVFLQLYQQGYPIDQLLRVMIERVETTVNGTRLVLVNSPNRGTPESFERFLRACAMLRHLQQYGYLGLESSAGVSLLGPLSGTKEFPNPTLKEFTDAEANGFLLKTNTTGGWLVYKKHAEPKFVLKSDWRGGGRNPELNRETEAAVQPLDAQAELALNFLKNAPLADSFATPGKKQDAYQPEDYAAITNLIVALNKGIVIQGEVSQGTDSGTRLILRSFNRAMESVASEQAGLEAVAKQDPNFSKLVPAPEQQPVLKMIWGKKDAPRLAPPLEVVQYAGKTYQITDVQGNVLGPNATWNRDVFRLMVALGSLVTVDISKFQRQVLELSQ